VGFENGRLVRVVLKATHKATGIVNVNALHYDLIDSAVPGNNANDPQSLADAFRDDVLGDYNNLYSNEWTIAPVEVIEEKDPQNPDAARSAWTSGTAHDGTRSRSGDKAPKAECAIATLYTEHIGRRFRGRMFIGGDLRQADDADGVWLSGQKGYFQAFIDAIPLQPDIASGASASVAHWCVYSRTQRGAPGGGLDPYASAVTSVLLRDEVHWLRSRER
jgi:hypothetical protein